jgi:hypothetical protein
VAVRSLSSSKTDAIIQLVKAGSVNVFPVRGVTRKEFESPQSLFSEFVTSPFVQMQSWFRRPPTAEESISMPGNIVKSTDGRRSVLPNSVPAIKDDNGSEQMASDGSHDSPFTEEIEEDGSEEDYTEEEKLAVRVIETAYVRRRRRRRVEPPRYITDKFALDKWFKLFNALQDIPQVSRYYLGILRGPLPHLMICLDAYRMEIAKQMSHAKKAFTGDHRSIEDALARMSEIK